MIVIEVDRDERGRVEISARDSSRRVGTSLALPGREARTLVAAISAVLARPPRLDDDTALEPEERAHRLHADDALLTVVDNSRKGE